MPLGQRRRGYSRARSRTADEKLTTAIYNPEEDWDDATDPFGEVYDLDKQAVVVRRMFSIHYASFAFIDMLGECQGWYGRQNEYHFPKPPTANGYLRKFSAILILLPPVNL
jgi:hypothetical protein